MSTEVDFLGQTRIVPESGEDDWGDEVSEQLIDLLTVGDFFFFRASGNLGFRLTSATQVLAGGGTITPSAPVMKLSAASPITVGTITDGSIDGQILILMGLSDTNTVRLNHGSNCQLKGDVILGLYDTIKLRWDQTIGDWIDIGRN